MNDDSDTALSAAARSLRAAPEPGWERISGAVLDAVRSSPRTSWPLTAEPTAPSGVQIPAGALAVSDHVLRSAIASTVRDRHPGRITVIEFGVDGHALRHIVLEITAPFGVDLRALSDEVRRTAAEVARDVLGDTQPPVSVDDIDVVVSDIDE
ncbi:hypothetical protein G4H71_14135 [Rhodococcus triatomae]|uniref:Asp23/Gls24 family envelope stress response protein n=1 Tax=Rhodococcus triatomae TaxID=300028 RepID=A0A1G8NRB1_9NOCA|nr:hypothetical protein [Rhodococcus triatomae]QNG20069.1 hypothetical protein G4H72_16240 [Rhodococcus triatomae]QNG24015.1 hypothetical protein G4H71_14135 [Rhodococcus triatomae]SDI82753.1 hypothetical protein SAMN05444695_111149 [Rhodococcus triatomae]